MLRHIGLTTAGESHGRGLLAIVTGLPAGVTVTEGAINADLARRQVGFGRGGRMRIETDQVTIVSGVRHGLTIGSPVGLQIANRDWDNWQDEMAAGPARDGFESARQVNVPRPGHADLAGAARFGHSDMRNVLERASARETAARVAGGAVCRALLTALGIQVRGHVLSIGGAAGCADPFDADQWACIEASDVRCADETAAQAMRQEITAAGAVGDTLGGIVAVEAEGVLPGLGSCASWDDRLDAKLAAALMSIPAIKSVEFGLGREVAERRGSAVHDPIARGEGRWWALSRASNNAGGIEGGMSNGERIVARLAMKPIPTLTSPLPSVDLRTGAATEAHAERSDVCAVPAASIVAEAMVALVLADAILEKLGNGCLPDVQANFTAYCERLRRIVG